MARWKDDYRDDGDDDDDDGEDEDDDDDRHDSFHSLISSEIDCLQTHSLKNRLFKIISESISQKKKVNSKNMKKPEILPPVEEKAAGPKKKRQNANCMIFIVGHDSW